MKRVTEEAVAESSSRAKNSKSPTRHRSRFQFLHLLTERPQLAAFVVVVPTRQPQSISTRFTLPRNVSSFTTNQNSD
jgi:hypothetical protein